MRHFSVFARRERSAKFGDIHGAAIWPKPSRPYNSIIQLERERGVRGMVAGLDLREMTGRRRYRVGAYC